ncbi:hypothetical protein I215_03950 [Galbibacter marinus]|uniref:Uncharacterized protein n=1 Tax=Galbibacter marinus TaxID=555500 RepID=K2QMG7_9FLAO|nr:hypothetical protein I215_03950 [Galbibacter marinus]
MDMDSQNLQSILETSMDFWKIVLPSSLLLRKKAKSSTIKIFVTFLNVFLKSVQLFSFWLIILQ